MAATTADPDRSSGWRVASVAQPDVRSGHCLDGHRLALRQERLEAATAAGARAEQQLARVLADWRASVAQMAATQVQHIAH